MELDVLYHRGSSGAVYSWRVWTEGSDIVTEYGQVDGKKQIARKTAEAKNVGKTNETTVDEQAIAEAKAMWTHKLERRYRRTLAAAKTDEIFLPMLASDFEKRRGQKKEGHTYPADIQPKLNGVRCLAYWDGEELKLLSRGGKDYNIPHVVEALKTVLPLDMVLDGELYSHGESLQTITSWVKKLRANTAKIGYHVYDCVLLNAREAQWPERHQALCNFTSTHKTALGNVVNLVETTTVSGEEGILEAYAKAIEQGYEGAVVRMFDGSEYRFGYRSKRLLKFKSFKDDEFKVVAFTTGVGKFEDCPIWVCETKDGKPFRVVCKGDMETRKQMLQEASTYVGQFLTVKYFELTDDGIPQFPVGIAFRLPEDM